MILNFARLMPREIAGGDLPPNTIALSITKSVNELAASEPDIVLTSAHVMSFVQRAWRLNPVRANKSELILAIYTQPQRGKLILGTFEIGREGHDGFSNTDNNDEHRYSFLAKPAKTAYWKSLVGHYLAKPKQGEANPVRYYNFDEEEN